MSAVLIIILNFVLVVIFLGRPTTVRMTGMLFTNTTARNMSNVHLILNSGKVSDSESRVRTPIDASRQSAVSLVKTNVSVHLGARSFPVTHVVISEREVLDQYKIQIAADVDKSHVWAHCGAGRDLISNMRKHAKRITGLWQPIEEWSSFMKIKHTVGNVTNDLLIEAIRNSLSTW